VRVPESREPVPQLRCGGGTSAGLDGCAGAVAAGAVSPEPVPQVVEQQGPVLVSLVRGIAGAGDGAGEARRVQVRVLQGQSPQVSVIPVRPQRVYPWRPAEERVAGPQEPVPSQVLQRAWSVVLVPEPRSGVAAGAGAAG